MYELCELINKNNSLHSPGDYYIQHASIPVDISFYHYNNRRPLSIQLPDIALANKKRQRIGNILHVSEAPTTTIAFIQRCSPITLLNNIFAVGNLSITNLWKEELFRWIFEEIDIYKLQQHSTTSSFENWWRKHKIAGFYMRYNSLMKIISIHYF